MTKERWEYLKNLKPQSPRWKHVSGSGTGKGVTYYKPETLEAKRAKFMLKYVENNLA